MRWPPPSATRYATAAEPVVIDHVAEDENFCRHPTPQKYGFQSYISVPIIRPDGRFFGTLCAIDPKPARVNTPETIGMFTLFADLIAFHLDTQERLRLSETALLDERETAQLREQFIAVLGHDLRNPLNAVRGGAELLQMMPLDEKAAPVVALIQRSAARMAGLIDNVLDFARGRLGGGLSLSREADTQSGDGAGAGRRRSARTAWPGRAVHGELALERPVHCDGARIAQMFSNLLANALIHGDPRKLVRVCARSDGDGFELSVVNHGDAHPARDRRAPVPALLARLRPPRPAGARARALHRLRDRARARGHARSRLVRTGDALHLPHVERDRRGARQSEPPAVAGGRL